MVIAVVSLAADPSPAEAIQDQESNPSRARKPASFWVEQLKSDDPSIRSNAASTLGLYASESKLVLPALLAAFEDPNEEVRRSAAEAFGQLGSAAKEAVPSLSQIITTSSGPKRAA